MARASTIRVEVDVSVPIAQVTLINPPLNVIDLRRARLLVQVLSEIESRPDISVIVFEGDARAFSAGVDVKAHLPEQIHEMLTSFHAVIRALVASRKVTIAAVVLATLIGQKRAAELILTGRQFSGDEAAAMGLATRSVAAEDLESVVERMLAELRALSPVALAHAKKAIYAWDAIHFDKGLARAEKIYLEELISTADAREGIIAFLDKRPPKWTGK